ncbi:unnamed protein product, partial [Prorocentrum cordatum]
NMKKLLLLVAKLGLKRARYVRAVDAVLFRTRKLEHGSAIAHAALEAVNAWADGVEEMQPEHPPAAYTWAAITRPAAAVQGAGGIEPVPLQM